MLSARSDYCSGIDESQRISAGFVRMCGAGHILQCAFETTDQSSHTRPYVERRKREDSSFQRSNHAAAREGATVVET